MVRHHLHGDFDHFVGVRIAPLRTEISVARRAKLPAQVAAGEPSGSTSQPGAATAKIVVGPWSLGMTAWKVENSQRLLTNELTHDSRNPSRWSATVQLLGHRR